MELNKTLKKDLYLLARSHGLKVTTRMTKMEIVEVYGSSARKKELLDLARLLGHKVTSRNTKQELLNLCIPPKATAEASRASAINVNKEKATALKGDAERLPKSPQPKEPEIDLPWRYNENRLVLMPVNPGKIYGYWEVTDEVDVAGQKYKTADYQLVLSLVAAKENNKPYVIKTVEIDAFGEYYFDHYLAGQTVWLELNLKDRHSAKQIPVLFSLKTQMPTDYISESNEELYLTVLNGDSDKPTLVFSGQTADGKKSDEKLFLGEFESFPRFGY